jgi:hypothetical protein
VLCQLGQVMGRRVSLVTLLAQPAVLPEKYLDLGALDACRNVAVVREGVVIAQVGRLGWMNSGQTPWRQVGQTRQTSPDQGCSASGGLSAADTDLAWPSQTP